EAGDGDVVIEIDPGMAFGTGLHPTTRLCLRELERRLRPGMEVMDLGTGSGIQAIAAAKLGAARVLALDTDPEAVKAARAHVLTNGLSAVVTVAQGTIPHPSAQSPFDLVVANITAGVIGGLAQSLMAAIKPQGALIAGGILADRAGEVRARLTGAGGRVIQRRAQGDWRTLVVAPIIPNKEARA
ncbi:MAG: 50S ribosomal protein L11 methyltransferase, partial [Dehalococcoidia bacterium]